MRLFLRFLCFILNRQLDQQRLVVSFEKVKLTNNESDQTGQIILNSMHKFQPRIHLVIVSDQWNASHGIDLQRMKHKTFVFDLTAFTAVTAYQNQLVSHKKCLISKISPFKMSHFKNV